jgi:hypothetical protein
MTEEAVHWGLTPFESFMMNEKTSRRPSGTAVAGLVLGSVGAALGIGAWIFAPIFSNAKANGIRDLANAQFAANNAQINSLAGLLGAERAERVAQGVTMTQTINDTVSGSQQGTLTAQQAAELSAMQSVQNNLLNQAILGNLSENPQKVQIYSAPQPCGCPGSCGA